MMNIFYMRHEADSSDNCLVVSGSKTLLLSSKNIGDVEFGKRF